ncbi:MAG: hypothetical protein K2L64_03900, partial [Ureaplasma sp.]|nr:hypothetical protein [Ureaplasma sp.]
VLTNAQMRNADEYTINSFKSFIISNDFKTFIFENLKDNKNNVVSLNSIGICSFNEDTKLLTINSSNDYKFTIYQDNIPIFTSTFSISLSNINFYLDRPLLNLNSLHEILENEIKNNKYTKSDFAYYFNLNNEYYKNLIAKNLYTINNQKIDESEVESVSLYNGNLMVSLTPPTNESYSIQDNDNFSLNINNLTIKNLPYLKSITLSNLSILKKVIQQEIDINKFDIGQFQSYLKNNEESVKLLISNNLYISDTNKIDIDQISSVSYDGENINIELKPPKDTKYSLESNNYASLENNILTIYLIKIYKDFQLSNLSNLVQEIQKKIINEKFTIDDLKEYIKTENGWMKQLISNNLYISNESSGDSSPISIDRISNIILSNNDIEILLNTDNNTKYSLKEENLDISLLDNSKLIVKNLKYFIATKLFGVSELYNSIKEIIVSNNYTLDTFSSYVNTNNQYLKSLIASKLSTSNNKKLDESSISDIKFSNDNLLITFVSSENHKYIIEENANAIIENDVLQISNLF